MHAYRIQFTLYKASVSSLLRTWQSAPWLLSKVLNWDLPILIAPVGHALAQHVTYAYLLEHLELLVELEQGSDCGLSGVMNLGFDLGLSHEASAAWELDRYKSHCNYANHSSHIWYVLHRGTSSANRFLYSAESWVCCQLCVPPQIPPFLIPLNVPYI